MASAITLEDRAIGPERTGEPPVRLHTGFLISPILDSVLLIGSPLLALTAAAVAARTRFATSRVSLLGIGTEETPPELVIGTLVMAHLVITWLRSHGNEGVFRQHRWRFTLVPALLLLALLGSGWVRAIAATVAVLWDVHHSGLQTFGLARMYDRLRGNPSAAGRTLDLLLNHLLYAGPILAGAGFMVHVHAFYSFETVGDAFFSAIPAAARNWHPWIGLATLAAGAAYLTIYLGAAWRLHRNGHAVSVQKVALLVSTGLCSVVSWGLNSFGMALITMKLFHVVQYFALVAWVERESLGRLFRLPARCHAFPRAVLLLAAIGLPFGLWGKLQQSLSERGELALSIILTVTLLHFWYDGFIWSVRKGQL